MEPKDLLSILNIEKVKQSIFEDLINGDMLDKLYEALKPYILKALKEALK